MGLYGQLGCERLGKYAVALAWVFEVNVIQTPIMSPYAHDPRSVLRSLTLPAYALIGGPLFVTKLKEHGVN